MKNLKGKELGRKRRSKWVKKCSECGKVLRSHNKSLLCGFHFKEKYRREHKEQIKETDKRYYQKNKVRIIKKQIEYNKKYNQRPEVKARMKEYNRNYQVKNKDKIKEESKRRKMDEDEEKK